MRASCSRIQALIDNRGSRAGDRLVTGQPRAQIRIRLDRQLGIVRAQSIEDQRRTRPDQLLAVSGRKLRSHGRRVDQVAVGGNAL